jgi:hypothetical protein
MSRSIVDQVIFDGGRVLCQNADHENTPIQLLTFRRRLVVPGLDYIANRPSTLMQDDAERERGSLIADMNVHGMTASQIQDCMGRERHIRQLRAA